MNINSVLVNDLSFDKFINHLSSVNTSVSFVPQKTK